MSEFVARYHYLGYKTLVGTQMRYAVHRPKRLAARQCSVSLPPLGNSPAMNSSDGLRKSGSGTCVA
ncbi:MAG: hypothetical protein OXL68_21315 [Paracoccaceae bacterium]|nr:hypothetical protein [Paracoccaceae bacterium]